MIDFRNLSFNKGAPQGKGRSSFAIVQAKSLVKGLWAQRQRPSLSRLLKRAEGENFVWGRSRAH